MKKIPILAVFCAIVMMGCQSPRHTSVYAPPEEEGIASRGVDSHDYDLVVEKMVSSMLRHGLQTDSGAKPVITLGPIYNHTPYRVETRMIGENIRVQILKSGLAKFSTATDAEHRGGESGDLYKQLEFQNESGNVNPATIKTYGQLVGADYILYGNIYNVEQKGKGVTEANFRFNLTLTEVKTGLAVWADTKPIRKNIR